MAGMSNLIRANKETIPVENLMGLVNRLSREAGLSGETRELLESQIAGLQDIYGRDIQAAVALNIISQQIEVTKTGLIRKPVGIVEFIESPEYMNQGAYVRPAIMENLYNLFCGDDQYWEVCLGGAIGIGKNYFADMAVSYILYKMSCLYSPQAYYGLAPGSDIVFVHQSKTLLLARKVVFNQFAARLEASGYFPKYFPFSGSFKAQLKFPNNIQIIPVSSSDTAALGMNVFCAILDELNFMGRTRRSRHSQFTGETEYDQAEKLYTSIYRRLESRYMQFGQILGKIFLISSANYKGDFIDRKEEEARKQIEETGKTNIYVMHLSQWEALPPEKFCGKKFWVLLPEDKFKGAISESKPAIESDSILEVPVEYLDSFTKDLIGSIRDLAGIPVARRNRIIEQSYVETAFSYYEKVFGGVQIFPEPETVFEDIDILESLINIEFTRSLSKRGPFGAHVDLALTGDSAGIAIGHVAGSKDIGSRTIFDPQKGRFDTKTYGELPVYAIVGLLKVMPPAGGEIDLNTIRDLLFLIADYIPLQWITFDTFQSASLIQSFRSRGVASYTLSVDKSPAAYLETKFAMAEQRVMIPRHVNFEDEIDGLEQDAISGKIDHVVGGSKDVADSVAGVIFEFSKKKMSYRKKGNPEDPNTVKRVPSDIRNHVRPSISQRPSTGREELY